MAITVNDAIAVAAPKAIDNKYGVFASGVFRAYVNVAEANSTIPSAFRSLGLTVLVNNGTDNVEYWYQDSIADGGLALKSNQVTATSPLTFTSGTLAIAQATGSVPGYLASADWTAFNNKVSSVISVGSGAVNIQAGTSSGVVSIKTLAAGTNVTLGDAGGLITVNGVSWSGANLGSGAQVYTTVSGNALQFRSFTAGAGLVVTQNTNDVNYALAGAATPAPANTSNSTPSVITSVTIPAETAGIMIVTMIGLVAGSAVSSAMSQQYVRYYKSGGVLNIIDGVFELIPLGASTITGASWTIIANGSTNNFDIQVTGVASTTIKWSATIQNYTNS